MTPLVQAREAGAGRALRSSASLEALDIEALALNLDASLRVHARPQFFSWTQGLLQGLMPHDLLMCVMPTASRSAFEIDAFSTLAVEPGDMCAPLASDVSLVPRLIERWRAHRHGPMVLDAARSELLRRSPFARALDRIGAAWVSMHGCHDVDGEVTGFYLLAAHGDAPGPRQSYYLQLVVPFLHSAWVRSRMRAERSSRSGAANGEAVVGDDIVTAREREILQWIYLGKSNAEIGLILGISALTVKNHVQNMLRKLNVVNRAQAVGKALDARILRP